MKDDHAELGSTAPPAGSNVSQTHPELVPGLVPALSYFGNYDLIAEMGRGAMGVVYKARQRNLDRVVALKMILSGRFASNRQVQRFRAEAEAAAALDHPNIVPIYEVGQHEGWHYFSMKLIEGGNLAQQIDRFREDPRSAARFMVKVARAVHHAHQRGILHRDIKPSNILLDADGEPYIADLGLAKHLTRDVHMTQSEAVLGTPAYMAPEQASGHSGEATTACDVYSLGAVLFEMIAGRPPFAADSASELLLQVQDQEAPSLRSVNARIDRDLETICQKCLSKDLLARYDSAGALADDLERWLGHEPIHARPTSRRDRIVKFVRRHRTIVAGILVVVIVLVGGIVATAWQAVRATSAEKEMTRQRNEAIAARADAERQRDIAETEAQRAERRTNEFWQLARTLIFNVDAASINQGPTVARKIMVEAVLKHFDNLQRELEASGQSEVELVSDISKALERVGDVQYSLTDPSLGEPRAAIESYRRAAALLEPWLAGKALQPRARDRLSTLYSKIGILHDTLGQRDESIKTLTRAVKLVEDSRSTATDTVKMDARMAVMRGSLAQAQDDPQTRLQCNRAYLEAARQMAERSPGSYESRIHLWSAYGNLAQDYRKLGDSKAAAQANRSKLAITELFLADDPQSLRWLHDKGATLRRLADCLDYPSMGSADYVELLGIHNQTIDVFLRLVERDPRDANARIALLLCFPRIAKCHAALEKLEESLAACRDGLKMAASLQEAMPENVTIQAAIYALEEQTGTLTLYHLKQIDDAIAWYRKALASGKRLVQMENREVLYRQYLAAAHKRLAVALKIKDGFQRSRSALEASENSIEAVRILDAIVTDAKGRWPDSVCDLIACLIQLGDHEVIFASGDKSREEAIQRYRKANEWYTKAQRALDDFLVARPDFPEAALQPPGLRQSIREALSLATKGIANPDSVQLDFVPPPAK